MRNLRRSCFFVSDFNLLSLGLGCQRAARAAEPALRRSGSQLPPGSPEWRGRQLRVSPGREGSGTCCVVGTEVWRQAVK